MRSSGEARKDVEIVPLSRPLLELAIARERDDATRKLSNLANMGAALLREGHAFAMFAGNLFCGAGGVVPCWHGRAEAWLLVSREARPRHVALATRLARAWFDGLQNDPAFARLEIYVRAAASYRDGFARALGMTRDGTLQAWGPDGSDYCLYSRVRF